MATERKCPSCGNPVTEAAPQGLCPECLMKAGFGTGVAPEPGEQTRPSSFVAPSITELAPLFPALEILNLLGQGGMGAVYKARQRALDRLVALKILPPQPAGDTGFADRFTREARALARLNHPNIVGVHEFGKAGAFHYFLMEFVDGANLRQIEQAGKLAPQEALRVIPQICEALQFAHDEGIVHRDIKPENILVDRRGRVKIADFGIAKILGQTADPTLTGAKDIVGTPHYMAPEQVEKPRAVDHRADIFSLGVVFYEMLTGELPLGKFAPPSRRVQVDVRFDDIVLRALEKEPERRYQHASEVKTDVETIANEAHAGPARSAGGKVGEFPGNIPDGPEGTDKLRDKVDDKVGGRGQAARYNLWEQFTIGLGMVLFLAFAFALPQLRPWLRDLLTFVWIIGFCICALRLVGLWPFDSPLFPQPSFSSRNLASKRQVPPSDPEPANPSDIPPERLAEEMAKWRRHFLVKAACFHFSAVCFFVAAISFAYTNALAAILSVIAVVGFGTAGLRNLRAASAAARNQGPGARALRQRPSEPAIWQGHLAFYCACLSGLIPTIFYWLAPWLVPWLKPEGRELMIWLTLAAAVFAVVIGMGARQNGLGRVAIWVGGINLAVWVLFFIAGLLSEESGGFVTRPFGKLGAQGMGRAVEQPEDPSLKPSRRRTGREGEQAADPWVRGGGVLGEPSNSSRLTNTLQSGRFFNYFTNVTADSAKGLRLECWPGRERFATNDRVYINCRVTNTTDSIKPVAWTVGGGNHFCLCTDTQAFWGGLLPVAFPKLNDGAVVRDGYPPFTQKILYLPPAGLVDILLDCGYYEKPTKFTARIVYDPLSPRNGWVSTNDLLQPPWADQVVYSQPFVIHVAGAATNDSAHESGPSFGPVFVRQLNTEWIESANRVLNLEDGRVFSIPTNLVALNMPRPFFDWLVKNQLDLFVDDAAPKKLYIHLDDGRLRRVAEPLTFDSVSATEVQRLIESGRGSQSVDLYRSEAFKEAFAFKTREGTLGVLQLIAPTDEPPGTIKVRYKLVVN